MGYPGYGVTHASDNEVRDERVATVVDAVIRKAGALVGHGKGVSAAAESPRLVADSPYQHLFGEGYLGRPRSDEHPTGRPTGDKKLTETARRRASRVLRVVFETEFNALMDMELKYLAGIKRQDAQEVDDHE